VEQLGSGGFGEVWKAYGPGGFTVALKFVRMTEPSSAPELRALELMKDIHHPNLLALFGAWQRGGYLIVAMELADGTLWHRWQEAVEQGQSGIPATELFDFMEEAAKGIDFLNAIPIQHRDIKPRNLLLVGGGVKVGDFGLAKLLEHTANVNSGAMTPAYAAPEFLNKQISPQSDQYSLAVTYCQMRGGRLPFTGTNAQVMTGHLMRPPDLTMLPEAERPVVGRALAKAADDRWPSCRDFILALRDAIEPSVAPEALPVSDESAPTANETTDSFGRSPSPSPAPRNWQEPEARKLPVRLLAFALLGCAALTLAALLGLRPWDRGGNSEKGGDQNRDGGERQPELEQEFVNSLRMRLVLVRPGTFQMGSPPNEKDRAPWGEDLREVEIAQAFYLGAFEVTQGQYEAVMGENPSRFQGDPNRPVDSVTWEEARAFCTKLSQKEERRYRLPRGEEWEYACRAGSTKAFAFGPTLAAEDAVFGLVEEDAQPAPVGSRRANEWGLYDMHGNVREWCEDDHRTPGGVPDGKVLRGGAFPYPARTCRSASIHWEQPTLRSPDNGFRVLLELDPPKNVPE
jgi:formylglycine-generating enzyme required for sulfatase activity